MKKLAILLPIIGLLGCQQETTGDRVKRLHAGCEREFLPDEYRSNQCKLRLMLELHREIQNDRLDNARRY
jgi:hypothetical protein